jgi:hypothetical protein
MNAITPKQYKVGDALETSGDRIVKVVGQTNSAGVFIIAESKIRWELYSDTMTPAAQRAMTKFEGLWYEVLRSTRKGARESYVNQIANAFFRGLHATTEEAADACFTLIEEIVHFNTKANQCLSYLFGAWVCLLIAIPIDIAVCYGLGRTFRTDPIFLAAAAGAVGAMASVLQRVGSLDINPLAPLWYAVLQGGARIALGMLFGVFFALANKANMVLGTFAKDLSAILVFGIVAGISERFVPEILQRLESTKASADSQETTLDRGEAPE